MNEKKSADRPIIVHVPEELPELNPAAARTLLEIIQELAGEANPRP